MTGSPLLVMPCVAAPVFLFWVGYALALELASGWRMLRARPALFWSYFIVQALDVALPVAWNLVPVVAWCVWALWPLTGDWKKRWRALRSKAAGLTAVARAAFRRQQAEALS